MKTLISIAAVIATLATPAFAASMPNLTGRWKPLGSDDRVMTFKHDKDKITIMAPDLSCTLTDLKSEPGDAASIPSMTASSTCDDESDTIYLKETLSVVRVGRDLLLIDAAVQVRHVNENVDPKIDESFSNQPAAITIYRKVQ